MKQVLFFFAVVVLTTSGCDKRDVRKSATLNLDFEVEVNTDSTLAFEKSAVMDAFSNSAIASIKNDIDRYEVKSIKYSIWELYGNDSCTFTGSLGIQRIGDPESVVYYSYNNFGFDLPQEKIEIPWSAADQKSIEAFLLAGDGLLFKFSGTLSHAPTHFVMNVELNVDALAEK